MAGTSKVTAYLVLAKDKRTYGGSAKVKRVSQKKPALAKGEIALKVVLDLPTSVFEEFVPHVEIKLPEVPRTPIRVDADWDF